jgi:hypothetical protein
MYNITVYIKYLLHMFRMYIRIGICMIAYAQITMKCDTLNKSTYIIPSADLCIDNGYYFKNITQCMYADGRDQYCIGRDGHFCGLRKKGVCKDYYQVECG